MYSLTSLVSLGLDSFFACLVIGKCSVTWHDRAKLAILFGLCDGLATTVGSLWPHRLLEVPAVLIWAFSVFLMCKAAIPSRRFLGFLPALLSLDNLFSGSPAGTAPAAAISSTLMSFCGFALAATFWHAYRSIRSEV